MLFSRFAILFMAGCASGIRRVARTDPIADGVACPFLASLVSAGYLTPGSRGEVSDSKMTAGLMSGGASAVFSAFQTAGIVGFEDSDTYQFTRLVAVRATESTKYINLYNMAPQFACDANFSNTPAGYPCNMNPEYQQHGYSASILDPTDGKSRQEAFDAVFEAATVLETIDGVDERVLTAKGMGILLYNARQADDMSSENSLNSTGGLSGSKMEYFHPSITDSSNYLPLSQWQAVLAWTGFWESLRRESPSGVLYMPYSDLESTFLYGKFPDDFVARDWGLNSMFNFISKNLGGVGAGDELVAQIDAILSLYGEDASETTLYAALYTMLYSFGAFTDAVSNPDPSR